MKIIGLTGGIATGKSTVSNMFKQLNIPVIDADIIAKKLLDIDGLAYKEVIEAFGPDIVMKSSHINRKELGRIIFNDIKKRELLNSIVHPKVYEILKRKIAEHRLNEEDIVVVDIPLLFESKMDKLTNINIVVFVDRETQFQRLISRDNITKEDAISRINSQMPLTEKVVLADIVIDNSQSILDTKEQLMKKLKDNNIIE